MMMKRRASTAVSKVLDVYDIRDHVHDGGVDDYDADYNDDDDADDDEEKNESDDYQVKSLGTGRTTHTAPWSSSFQFRLTKFRYTGIHSLSYIYVIIYIYRNTFVIIIIIIVSNQL